MTPNLQSCPGTSEGLELCVRCEDSVVDESVHAHVISSTGVQFERGPDGGNCRLDSGSTINVAESARLDLPSFTIQAWIQPATLPSGTGRFGLLDRDVAYGMFIMADGSVVCQILGGTSVTAPGAAKVGIWTSLACTLGGGMLAIWVNGKHVAGKQSGDVTGSQLGSGLAIGANDPSGDHFDGHLDNLRLWRGVQTPQQICAAAESCQ